MSTRPTTPYAAGAVGNSAGARLFNTGGGKIVAFAGDPPKRVTITEWDSLEAAVAFRTGKAWKDLSPQRDKALKVHRSYAVEATR